MTAENKFEFLHLEVKAHGVAVLKISRPKTLNALNTQVLVELRSALQAIEADPKVRVLVFTGDGDKSFIAGADISEMKDKTDSDGVNFARLGHAVTKLFQLMSKPTIAAVNGYALGGGCEMAISCDFIIASERAVFAQPEVGLGIIPGFGGTVRLAQFVGGPIAKDLIFSGRKVKADEALRIGLANQVFPAEGFLEKVVEFATTIAKQSRSAVASSKKLLNEFQEAVGLDYKLDAEAQEFGGLFGSHDQREGMGAFVEKRTPSFEGLQ